MSKADFEGAKQRFPAINNMGEQEWLAFFNTREGFTAVGRILGDIYQEIEAQKARTRGQVRMGRRPGLEPVPLDQIFSVIFPEKYSNEEFPTALKALAVGLSQREVAAKLHCSQAHVFRMMNGKVEPSMADLEAVAKAFDIEPQHFVEWRAMFMAEVMSTFLRSKPNLGISAIQHLIRATRKAA